MRAFNMPKQGELLKLSAKRMILTISSLILLIVLSSTVIILEMNQHKANYLQSMEDEIKKEVDYLSYILCNEVLTGKEDTYMSWMDTNGVSTGNEWQICWKENSLIYVKDSYYTKKFIKQKLTDGKRIEDVLDKSQIMILNEFEYKGCTYKYGLVVDEEALLLQGSIKRHAIYIYIVFTVMLIIIFCSIVLSVNYINIQDNEKRNISKRLVQTQDKVDALSEEQMYFNTGSKGGNYSAYEGEFLSVLLEKSYQAELMPMHILKIKLELSVRYYSKGEIEECINLLNKELLDTHIFLEVGKGEFVVLMYGTDANEARRMYEKINLSWIPKMEEKQIKVYMLYSEVKEGEKAIEAYEKLKTSMLQETRNNT